MPGALYGAGQRTLVLGTGASLAARADFAAIRQEAPQHIVLLVVDFYIVNAERAHLGAAKASTPEAATTTTLVAVIVIHFFAAARRRAARCFTLYYNIIVEPALDIVGHFGVLLQV